MMSDLSDYEILEYLMTSEFNDGLNPDEMRFLLIKFRNFYRILSGRLEYIKMDSERIKLEYDLIKKWESDEMKNLISERDILLGKISDLENRKLSFMERLLGKIIIKDKNLNEDKSI